MAHYRCFWYDSEGRPYLQKITGQGCPWPTCRFVHPDSARWETAVPSDKLPRMSVLADEEVSRLYGPPPPAPPYRRHSPSPPRRRPRSHSRNRDRDRSRDRIRDRSRDRRRPRERSSDSIRSSSRRASPSPVRHRLRTLSRRSRSRSHEPRRSSLYDSHRDRASTHEHAAQGSSKSQAEGIAALSPELPFLAAAVKGAGGEDPLVKRDMFKIVMPANVQATSSTAAAPASAPPVDLVKAEAVPDPILTVEDKRKAWAARIEHMSSAAHARTEGMRLDAEIHDITRLVGSAHFATLPEEERARARVHAAKLEARRTALQDEHKSVVAKLAEADGWPKRAPESPATGLDPQITAHVTALRDAVAQLSAQLHAHAGSGAGPPEKRRRLSVEGGEMGEAAGAAVAPAELEELTERMDTFYQVLMSVENDVHTLYGDMQQEMSVLREEMAERADAQAAESAKRIQALEHELENTGADISELANEVAGLVLERGRMMIENEELKVENEELKKQIAELQSTHRFSMDAMRCEIDALNTAVTLRLAHPPPAPAHPPDAAHVLDALRPSVVALIRSEIQPLLEGLLVSIKELFSAHDAQFFSTLLPRLSTTLRMAEAMRAYFERMGSLAPGSANGSGQH